jgi:pimeloyl-ACP methyl ester carboxylesterase
MLSSFSGGSLFGERRGEPPLAVLCLHGWGRTHRDFDRVLDATVPSVALDLPGFGASPAPPEALSSDDFARLVEPVLDEATSPVVLVGHSHGGRVALRLAARRPERVAGIVLIAAPVLRRQGSARPSRQLRLLKALRRVGLASEDRLENYRRQHGSADYRAAEGVQRDTLVTVINESFEAELAGLSCPVTFLWGSADDDVQVEVAQRAADMVGADQPVDDRPSVRLRVLEGVGHLVPTAAPEAVAEAISELLA